MHYHFIKYEYPRFALNYPLIKVINKIQISFLSQVNFITLYLRKLQLIHFMATRYYAINMILASYREACNIVECYTCNNL